MRRKLWVAFGVIALVCASAFAWMSTSLHVLRAALPGSQQVLIASAARGTGVEPFITRVADVLLPEPMRSAASNLSTWAYGSGDHGEVVIGHRRSPSVVAGWTYPWQVVSTRHDTFSATAQEVGQLLDAIARIALNRVDISHPSLIIELQDAPGPLTLHGVAKNNTFRFTYNLSDSAGQYYSQLEAKDDQPAESKELYVALPSSALSYFPPAASGSMQGGIASDMAFTKTLPNIMEQFQAGLAFGVQLDEQINTFRAMGVIEQAESRQFFDALGEWVALERAYISPVRQAFRLPDGTIGYELIPSPHASAQFSVVGQDGCQTAYIAARQVWRCHTSGITTFGTSYDAVQALRENLAVLAQTGRWQVVLPGAFAEQVSRAFAVQNVPEIRGLYISGGRASSGQGLIEFQ